MKFTSGLTGGSEMAITIRGNTDKKLLSIKAALQFYEQDHPAAAVELYRQNSISVRIRIIDPSFEGMEKSDRHSRMWKYLEKLPEGLQSDISMVVLLTPKEAPRSLANLEFEDPSQSVIK
jgi:hypothetical protein